MVYKSDNDCSAVNRKIESMCEKYITKESIRYECNEPFTENEVLIFHLKKKWKKYFI